MTEMIRVNFLIEKDVWEDLKEELEKRGYPRGVPSWLVREKLRDTLLHLQHGEDAGLEAVFTRRKTTRK